MVEDRDNLLYRPDLHPYREYDSNAVIPKPELDNPDVPQIPDKAKELIEDFEQVIEIIKAAPKGIEPIVPTIQKLIRRLQVAFPNGYYEDEEPPEPSEPIPEEVNPKDPEFEHKGSDRVRHLSGIGTSVYKIDKKIGNLPNLFPSPTNIVINVVKPRSIVDIAVDKYRKDTIDLQKYYLSQLQIALQVYFHQMMMIMAETNLPSIDNLSMDYDGKAVKVPAGQNLEHLHDYIVRSQVVREQKTRLFKKTHNVDQTVMHMRSWHVSEKERERYYTEKYGDSATYLDSEANSILRNSRSQYDKQYAQSLYDMYKYLNSSVIMIKDILDMSLNEAKAKGQLLNKGVDIFAVTEKKVNVNDAIASAVGSGKLNEAKNPQSVDDKSKSTTDTSTSTNSSSNTSSTSSSSSNSDVKDKSKENAQLLSDIASGKNPLADSPEEKARKEKRKHYENIMKENSKKANAIFKGWEDAIKNDPTATGKVWVMQWAAQNRPQEYAQYQEYRRLSDEAGNEVIKLSM